MIKVMLVFKGGPIDLLLSIPEIEEIIGEKPLDFVKTLIDRFNEIRDCKLVKSEPFSKVYDYFNEAKRCYITGNYRASLIIAFCALECCLRIDYEAETKTEWKGRLFDIIKMYFDKRKLPLTFSELAQIGRKVRNDITHPCHKEEYTHTTVWHNLELIKDLMNYIIEGHRKRNQRG